MEVMRARELEAVGQSARERAGLVRSGHLVRVRHGAYADRAEASAVDQHRRLLAGTAPLLGPSAVVSHASAGILHGLPVWEDTLGRVSVLRPPGSHGARRPHLHARSAPLSNKETTLIDGYRVTTLERTAVDLACCLGFERAVAVLDAALHAGASAHTLAEILEQASRRHGVATARAAWTFADARSESVGESISRVRLRDAGLPTPELQVNIFDAIGAWLARCDFGWLTRGVLGEFDGRMKYLGTPEEVGRTVMREKHREAQLRELGWVVVRWDWADLADRAALRRRVAAAFTQARPDAVRGSARPL